MYTKLKVEGEKNRPNFNDLWTSMHRFEEICYKKGVSLPYNLWGGGLVELTSSLDSSGPRGGQISNIVNGKILDETFRRDAIVDGEEEIGHSLDKLRKADFFLRPPVPGSFWWKHISDEDFKFLSSLASEDRIPKFFVSKDEDQRRRDDIKGRDPKAGIISAWQTLKNWVETPPEKREPETLKELFANLEETFTNG